MTASFPENFSTGENCIQILTKIVGLKTAAISTGVSSPYSPGTVCFNYAANYTQKGNRSKIGGGRGPALVDIGA